MKDPAYAIPKGTLAAIGTTFATYFVYFIMVGCVAVRFASGIVDELDCKPEANMTYCEMLNVTHAYTDCQHDRFCDYGSAVNQQVSVAGT